MFRGASPEVLAPAYGQEWVLPCRRRYVVGRGTK